MKLKKHFFLYIILMLVLFCAVFSYFRFFVNQDYFVEYEGTCDPGIKSCFVGCEDEECSQEYYYSSIEKYAPDLIKQCGKDITDCELANFCLPEDQGCSITFCDPLVDGEESCYSNIIGENLEVTEEL